MRRRSKILRNRFANASECFAILDLDLVSIANWRISRCSLTAWNVVSNPLSKDNAGTYQRTLSHGIRPGPIECAKAVFGLQSFSDQS